MKEKVYGTIKINSTIDITDPCYDEDVWCRINRFPIDPGEYECYTLTANDKETHGWGKRIAKIGLRIPGSAANNYELKGVIGVDAGMAGFFTCDNLKVFEDEILTDNQIKDVYIGEEYFCSRSGYGDGSYDVYVGYQNGKEVEVCIEFL